MASNCYGVKLALQGVDISCASACSMTHSLYYLSLALHHTMGYTTMALAACCAAQIQAWLLATAVITSHRLCHRWARLFAPPC